MTDLKPYEQYLWSPKRKEYEANQIPEDIDCIFCAQAEDDERISKLAVFEDDFLMVVLNIFPYNTGHLMVVPKDTLTLWSTLKMKNGIDCSKWFQK